jgi:hypothetical protein
MRRWASRRGSSPGAPTSTAPTSRTSSGARATSDRMRLPIPKRMTTASSSLAPWGRFRHISGRRRFEDDRDGPAPGMSRTGAGRVASPSLGVGRSWVSIVLRSVSSSFPLSRRTPEVAQRRLCFWVALSGLFNATIRHNSVDQTDARKDTIRRFGRSDRSAQSRKRTGTSQPRRRWSAENQDGEPGQLQPLVCQPLMCQSVFGPTRFRGNTHRASSVRSGARM